MQKRLSDIKAGVETLIYLDKFQPRFYQDLIFDAIENKGYKKVIATLPRRAGKDITAWNLCIRQALRKVCLIFYCSPTYSQCRKTIWDAITIDGKKFLDFIPPEVIETINQQEMKIRFINGSILQCIGADTYDTSLVGTNPYGIIFSEAALMNPNAYHFARPIMAANNGWMLFLTTPRGKNWFWELYKVSQELPDWFTYRMGVDETKHIPFEALMQEKQQMSDELYQQEYFCSFDRGVSGSYYGTYLDKLRQNSQIAHIPWEPGLKVHVAFDIGVHDATCLIFFQVAAHGSIVRIIDCYSNTGLGLDHYVKVIQDKPYTYGKYFFPHDIKLREWAGGAITRYDKAVHLGITPTLVPNIGLEEGIEMVWTNFHKFWIDENKCRSLINALENYYREWDEERQIHKDRPIHNWASNYADCLRYLAVSLNKTQLGTSPEQLEKRYNDVMYGDSSMPNFFKDHYPE